MPAFGEGNWRRAEQQGARLLQASTSEVYGQPTVHPQHEAYRGDVSPTGPRSAYDEGKRCAEALCFAYWRQHEVDARVVRILNIFGPGMHPRDDRVIPNFVLQALGGRPITVYGDGSQTRSFCFVSDLIDGLCRMQAHPAVSGPINLGSPLEFPIIELAEMVRTLTGSRSPITFRPQPADEPRCRCPDIRLAEETLNRRPRVGLLDDLRRTIEHYDAVLRLAPDQLLAPVGD